MGGRDRSRSVKLSSNSLASEFNIRKKKKRAERTKGLPAPTTNKRTREMKRMKKRRDRVFTMASEGHGGGGVKTRGLTRDPLVHAARDVTRAPPRRRRFCSHARHTLIVSRCSKPTRDLRRRANCLGYATSGARQTGGLGCRTSDDSFERRLAGAKLTGRWFETDLELRRVESRSRRW